MAAVRTTGEVIRHRLSIVAVLAMLLLMLAPIFWITATAFKPRNLATTVPPTVFFEPEISPFVKLFTKRSQLREQPTQEEYDNAPWWEQTVFDGGEKVVRSGKGVVQVSGYPSRFLELADRGDHLDRAGGLHGHNHGLRVFAVQGERARMTGCFSSCPPGCCRLSWSRFRCS